MSWNIWILNDIEHVSLWYTIYTSMEIWVRCWGKVRTVVAVSNVRSSLLRWLVSHPEEVFGFHLHGRDTVKNPPITEIDCSLRVKIHKDAYFLAGCFRRSLPIRFYARWTIFSFGYPVIPVATGCPLIMFPSWGLQAPVETMKSYIDDNDFICQDRDFVWFLHAGHLDIHHSACLLA